MRRSVPEVPSQRRLQRPPDWTGGRLVTFRAVFARHGLPGALAGLSFLLFPGTRKLLMESLRDFTEQPALYLGAAIALLVVLSAYAALIDRGWRPLQFGWIVYLGALSFWEEWVFRVAIPYAASGGAVDLLWAVLVSNLIFGAMHYFTLRWHWYWCVGAFLGGLFLSRQMTLHFDLALLAGFHWAGTFFNTPRSPGRGQRAG